MVFMRPGRQIREQALRVAAHKRSRPDIGTRSLTGELERSGTPAIRAIDQRLRARRTGGNTGTGQKRMIALESEEAATSHRCPALCEAFLRGEEGRAHALLDAGVDPLACSAHPWWWRCKEAGGCG